MPEQMPLFTTATRQQTTTVATPAYEFDLHHRIEHLKGFTSRYGLVPKTEGDLDEFFTYAYDGVLPDNYQSWTKKQKQSAATRIVRKARATSPVQEFNITDELSRLRRHGQTKELLTGLTTATFDDPDLCRIVIALSNDTDMPFAYIEQPAGASKLETLKTLTAQYARQYQQPARIYRAKRIGDIIVPRY